MTGGGTTDNHDQAGLRLRQASVWSSFAYELLEPPGAAIGSLRFAKLSLAKDARLAFQPFLVRH